MIEIESRLKNLDAINQFVVDADVQITFWGTRIVIKNREWAYLDDLARNTQNLALNCFTEGNHSFQDQAKGVQAQKNVKAIYEKYDRKYQEAPLITKIFIFIENFFHILYGCPRELALRSYIENMASKHFRARSMLTHLHGTECEDVLRTLGGHPRYIIPEETVFSKAQNQ